MLVMHQILTPTDEMLSIFSQIIRQHLKQWEQKTYIEPSQDIKVLALQISGAALLDLNLDDQKCLWIINEFKKLVKGFSSFVPYAVPGCPFSRSMKARKELQNFFEEVIQEQQSELGIEGKGTEHKNSRWNHSSSHPFTLLLNTSKNEQVVTLAELKD